MEQPPITRLQLARFLICPPLYVMLVLLVVEALLSAATTYLVIKAGRDVTSGEFIVSDLLYILLAQSTAYVLGAVSWIFAERAGCRAFGLYMMRFARDNRSHPKLLHDKHAREQTEPFLTGETFYAIFHLMYEVESQLKLLLGLVFNAIVLGTEIDGSLPAAYAAVFLTLSLLQWILRRRVARAYLENQRMTNRVTAQGYTAWDNVLSGNRYNLRLWVSGFKTKLRECLRAQIIAIMWREGLSAVGGILGLAIIFTTTAIVVVRESNDMSILIALAATLPRQIEMTHDVHELANGWNDLLAVWTRLGGIVMNMRPLADVGFDARIKFDRLILREGDDVKVCASVPEALSLVLARPTGRINIRGGNGSGKSTLLTALKAEIKNRAYYWPTADRLAFQFAQALPEEAGFGDDDEEEKEAGALKTAKPPGFSSGERQLRALQEIVAHTDAAIYLFDEWDANLDAANRSQADALVEQLAHRARVVEISHRDRA